jgi:hypothetical protein
MLTEVSPKLPMRDINVTKEYYLHKLGFEELGDYEDYLIVSKDKIEIHFFEYKGLDPKENCGGIYIRTDAIDHFYQMLLEKKVSIHPNGHLENKPWGQREFSLLDPDNNLLTFGQSIDE